jgi:hypothetical protein
VGNDGVGVDEVNEIVADWKVNPVIAADQGSTVGRSLDDCQLIGGADTTYTLLVLCS